MEWMLWCCNTGQEPQAILFIFISVRAEPAEAIFTEVESSYEVKSPSTSSGRTELG